LPRTAGLTPRDAIPWPYKPAAGNARKLKTARLVTGTMGK
jgi:hypothetical protein